MDMGVRPSSRLAGETDQVRERSDQGEMPFCAWRGHALAMTTLNYYGEGATPGRGCGRALGASHWLEGYDSQAPHAISAVLPVAAGSCV